MISTNVSCSMAEECQFCAINIYIYIHIDCLTLLTLLNIMRNRKFTQKFRSMQGLTLTIISRVHCNDYQIARWGEGRGGSFFLDTQCETVHTHLTSSFTPRELHRGWCSRFLPVDEMTRRGVFPFAFLSALAFCATIQRGVCMVIKTAGNKDLTEKAQVEGCIECGYYRCDENANIPRR
jgi:hypothetical protein